MDELIKSGEYQMTSREIAFITGKKHGHVCRDIKKLNESYDELSESRAGSGYYLDLNNQKRTQYLLTKNQCLVLATGYSTTLRIKLVNRWAALELEKINKSANFILPVTFPDALRQLADSIDENSKITLELNEATTKIEEDKPKVVFSDAVAGSSNSVLMREFAKEITEAGFELGQNKLFEWLRKNSYLTSQMRYGKYTNEPYQQYVNQGLFEVVTRIKGVNGEMQTHDTTKITGKGRVYFTKKLKEYYGFNGDLDLK